MTPKIIPCISRAILAQDEADGLPAVRLQAWQIQRKRTIRRQSLPRSRPGRRTAQLPHFAAAQSQMLKLPLGGRTLGAPPEGDHHARTTDHSYPPRRSDYLCGRVRPKAAPGATTTPGVTTSARPRAWPVRTPTPMASAASARAPTLAGLAGLAAGRPRHAMSLMFHGQGRGCGLARSGESCHRLSL